MKHIWILFIFCIACNSLCIGQLPHTFTQYTSEDGLTQKNIQGIIQDHKGLMWFATWDGLYKFDGYTFKNYKAHPGDSIGLSNNRLDNIKEDKYGCIWVQSYDHQIYRFNPKTELFQAIPYKNYLSQSLYVLPCGDVWVVTTQNELIHITIHPENGDMITYELLEKIAKEINENTMLDGITVSGGDPLFNPEDMEKVLKFLKEKTGKNIWMYTGYTLEQIRKDERKNRCLEYVDVLVDGPFIKQLYTPDLRFKGSSNQRIIKKREFKKEISEVIFQ